MSSDEDEVRTMKSGRVLRAGMECIYVREDINEGLCK